MQERFVPTADLCLQRGEDMRFKFCAVLLLVLTAVITPGKTVEKVMYSFCSVPQCSDGSGPFGALVADGQGNLYGTTSAQTEGYPGGEIYELDRATHQQIVLHGFCQQPDCADGDRAPSGLVADRQGNLYGSTYGGGY